MSKKSDGSQVKESTDSSATMDEDDAKGKENNCVCILTMIKESGAKTAQNEFIFIHAKPASTAIRSICTPKQASK